MKQLFFATGNVPKVEQAQFIARHFGLDVEIIRARDVFGDAAAYEEIGETVSEVAMNGAIEVARRVGQPVFTDDTDFRIPILDGFPGIRAGTFLKEFGRTEILKRMEGIADRTAIINSAVAYALPDGTCQVFTNSLHGTIAMEERHLPYPSWIAPSDGCSLCGGYNAIFIPEGHTRTLAEISPEEAMPWSYRESTLSQALAYIAQQADDRQVEVVR